jgi:hypothetical protein
MLSMQFWTVVKCLTGECLTGDSTNTLDTPTIASTKCKLLFDSVVCSFFDFLADGVTSFGVGCLESGQSQGGQMQPGLMKRANRSLHIVMTLQWIDGFHVRH